MEVLQLCISDGLREICSLGFAASPFRFEALEFCFRLLRLDCKHPHEEHEGDSEEQTFDRTHRSVRTKQWFPTAFALSEGDVSGSGDTLCEFELGRTAEHSLQSIDCGAIRVVETLKDLPAIPAVELTPLYRQTI